MKGQRLWAQNWTPVGLALCFYTNCIGAFLLRISFFSTRKIWLKIEAKQQLTWLEILYNSSAYVLWFLVENLRSSVLGFCNYDGSHRNVLGQKMGRGLYGLDVFADFIYFSDFSKGTIERMHKFTGENRTTVIAGLTHPKGITVSRRFRPFFGTTSMYFSTISCSGSASREVAEERSWQSVWEQHHVCSALCSGEH